MEKEGGKGDVRLPDGAMRNLFGPHRPGRFCREIGFRGAGACRVSFYARGAKRILRDGRSRHRILERRVCGGHPGIRRRKSISYGRNASWGVLIQAHTKGARIMRPLFVLRHFRGSCKMTLYLVLFPLHRQYVEEKNTEK